jgi:cyclophilin family peptidyl-prolyl cis-trans isomerase
VGTDKRERQKANRQLRLEQLQKQESRHQAKRRGLLFGVGIPLAVLAVVGLVWLTGRGKDDNSANATSGTDPVTGFQYGSGECAPAAPPEQPVTSFSEAPKLCIDPNKSYTATISTSAGDIEVDLDNASVPGTVNNFVNLSRFGFYDNTAIFRTDPSIDIIQGGGHTNSDAFGYTIPDEASGFSYGPGDLVMARTQSANSAGAQWFIVTGPKAASLDAQGTYVTFGHVTKGLDVAQKIIADDNGSGAPKTPVTVNTITIAENDTPPVPASTTPTTAGASTTTVAGAATTAAATTTSAG